MCSTIRIPWNVAIGIVLAVVMQGAAAPTSFAALAAAPAVQDTATARVRQPHARVRTADPAALAAAPGRQPFMLAALAVPTGSDRASGLAPRYPLALQRTDRASPSIPFRAPVLHSGVPLQLTLTEQQMWAINMRYQDPPHEPVSGAFEDVVVTVQNRQAPMRDVSRDVWGGLAAPFWAILHPTQSWRIFLPIPPK
jgi:hypothetical protein